MSRVEDENLDSILLTIENPTRRKILKRLSQESSYQLKLSRDLGFSQQLVAKHLDAMEEVGVVSSLMGASPHGPRRKEYLLNKSVSVSIDCAPNLFRAKVVAYDSLPEEEMSSPTHQLLQSVNEVMQHPEERSKIAPIGSLISEIDRRLGGLEDERSVLLYLRHLALKEVARVMSGMPIAAEKARVLYNMIVRDDQSLQGISRTLNLKESYVQKVLTEIERDIENV